MLAGCQHASKARRSHNRRKATLGHPGSLLADSEFNVIIEFRRAASGVLDLRPVPAFVISREIDFEFAPRCELFAVGWI